ncbi:hypothetical protein AVEN_122446-1 [Araneus ventricosus]|uniref:Uncharacterized protein n=1 Tax=Araneus ventricosus TaxID=182803 RepID=A0A4Y2FL00_ARAVE|nr:hypothetical protein AVEN_122446-1 [Araneus ventricosus]
MVVTKPSPATQKKVKERMKSGSTITPPSDKIFTGCWLLVKYYGKKSLKTFVGRILSEENGLFTVKYLLKSPLGENYTLPENEDVNEIESEQTIQIIYEPMFDIKRYYTFNILIFEFKC